MHCYIIAQNDEYLITDKNILREKNAGKLKDEIEKWKLQKYVKTWI